MQGIAHAFYFLKADIYNGIFRSSDGSIRVDLNAGKDGQGVMGYALSHEFTHFVEELSAEKFRKFTDVLFDVLGKNDVDVNRLIEAKEAVLRQTEEYKGRSDKDLRAIAYSEVVAEMMEPVLTDTDAISRISQKIKQQDKGLWGKIKDFIKGIVEKLKAAYRDMEPDSAIARMTKEAVTNSEAVLDAFSEAAADAVLNYNLQEGQKNNAREGVQFSQREYDSISKQFSDEIRQWVKDGQDGDRQFILGSTGEVLQGLGAIESDIYMNSDKINTILKEHPEITLEEIQQIPKIINDPILVMKSRNAGRSAQNTRMTMFGSVKGQNGLPVMVVFDLRPSENHFVISDMQKVTSAYTKTTNATSFVENSFILYADKKRTASLLRTIGFHMPIELLQSGYVGSVTYQGQNVNLYGEKFSDVFRKGTVLKSSRDSAGNTLTEAQQRYFADSQVRDEDGNLIPVYHRTDGDFTVFQRGKLGGVTLSYAADAGLAATSLVGHWFSDHDLGEYVGKNVVQSYLNIQTPYETDLLSLVQEITGFSSNPEMMQEHFENGQYNMVRKAAAEFTAWLRSEGYDGLKVTDQENGGVSYVVLDSRQAKLTTNQNPTGARDIRYSYRGVNAQDHDNAVLERAKEMLAGGTDKETVRQETGWFQGRDGKWRFEISDADMQLRYTRNIPSYSKLGDLIDHPKLFESYPDLRNVDVSFGITGDALGSYVHEWDSITLSNKIKNDPKKILDVLSHEIQHAIQDREGFSAGASPNRWNRALESGYDGLRTENARKLKELTARMEEIRKNNPEFYADMEALRKIVPDIPRADVDWETLEPLSDDPPEWQAYDKKRDELTEKYGEDKVFDFWDLEYDIERQQKYGFRTPTELYRDTAGEIEARDVEWRRDWDDNRRRSVKPDTGNEDTVFSENIRYSERYVAAEENPEIADLVQRVLSGDFKANDKVYLGTVSSQNAVRIQEITGIDVNGFRVAIEARQIEHILNRHGIEGSADHSMAQVSDISKIQYTLDNPDSITPAGKTSAYVYMRNGKNRTADTVLYEKDIGGKSYYTVQAIADTKAKTLYVVSAFIGESGYKKGTPQFTNAKSLGATSETAAVDVPTGNVAQTGTNVKGKNLESRRVSQEIKDAIEEYRQQQDVQSKAYRQMYERQLEEVKKSYQKQISSMESEYSADLTQIQDAFFQTVEAYEKGQFRNEHLEKALKQAMEAQRAQAEASKADNATWEKEFKRLLKAYDTSGRNAQRLKQTVEAQRARAKAKVEAARVTEQRGKLYRAVNEINRRLLNPTKTLYVPDSLAPAVTKFMQGLTEAMESPKNSWNVQGALESLQGQYQKLTQMNEGVFTQEYNQGILDLLDNAINAVGGTDFNKLSASQIEDVYSAVRSVLTAIRNENKMFAANLNKTYAEAAAAVRREEAALPNRKPTTGAVQDKAEKFGWNQLKPVYAMMRLGSDTLLKQYDNLRAGEDKWQRVIAAARNVV